jgi:hypothetical protein
LRLLSTSLDGVSRTKGGRPTQALKAEVTSVSEEREIRNYYAQFSPAELEEKERELLGRMKQEQKLLPESAEPI